MLTVHFVVNFMPRIKHLGAKIVLEVYLLDNSVRTVLIEPTTTVHDVSLMLANKMQFEDPEDDSLCFSLHESPDGINLNRALPGDTLVLPILEEWEAESKEDAKLVWQIMLFAESIVNSKDPKVIDMMYLQCTYNIISGKYPCDEKEAVHLAALQVLAKFGPHRAEVHKPGYLTATLNEYIPAPHVRLTKMKPRDWEQMIFAAHRTLLTKRPKEAYIDMIKRRPYFGAVLFAVKQYFDASLPKTIFLGISRRGIMMLRVPPNFTTGEMKMEKHFPLGDIYRWAYKPGETFYFEVKASPGRDAPEYRFKTPEGKHMSDLLTEYALALLREMGLNPDGTKREKKKKAADEEDASAGGGAGGGGGGGGGGGFGAHDTLAGESTYSGLGGDAGTLASAATRSGVTDRPPPRGRKVAPPPVADLPPPPPPPPEPEPEPEPAFEEDVEEEVEEEEAAAAEEEEAAADGGETPAGDDEDLPPGWQKIWDEGNECFYYFNEETEESQWEAPTA